jgi:ribosomal small subunit protein bTHX
MGKGDKKTKRGKLIIGSYGVRRKKKKKTSGSVSDAPIKKTEAKKAAPIKEKVEETTVATEEIKNEKPKAEQKPVTAPKKTKKETEPSKDAEEKIEAKEAIVKEEPKKKEEKKKEDTTEAETADKAKEE